MVLTVDGEAPGSFERLEDGRLERRMENVTHQLESMLRELAEAGCEVIDLEIDAPTLQDVFLHLTGRDLRE